MAYANRTEAVDMRKSNQYGSAAPKRAPQTAPKHAAPRPKVVKKTKAELRAEERRSASKAIKALAICAIFFTFIAFQIFSQVKVDELDRQIDSVNSEIEVVESENTRLSMEIDSTISLDKVDSYAQNVLGMVKVENYQVSYIDLSGGDAVIQSGGKVHQSLWETIKMYF